MIYLGFEKECYLQFGNGSISKCKGTIQANCLILILKVIQNSYATFFVWSREKDKSISC